MSQPPVPPGSPPEEPDPRPESAPGPYGGPPQAYEPPAPNPYATTTPDPIRPWPVIGGLVLGAVACWVYLAAVFFLGFAGAYNSSSDPAGGSNAGVVWMIVAVALALLPIVGAIVLLARQRTRQLGAGFVMGLAIGAIVGAGICALPWFGMFAPMG